MSVHVGNLTTELTVLGGDLPLTPGQVEKLITLVLERLEQRQRAELQARQAMTVRNESARDHRHGQ